MAKKGFLYTVAGILKDDESGYEKGKYLGPTATFNINPTSNDVKDYGDNMVVATDTSVTGGTTSVEINEMANELYAFMLGHTYDTEKDEVTCKQTDVAPYLGLGTIGVVRDGNKPDKYVVKFYKKVQFKEPNDENSTQQDTLTLTHTTLEGNLFIPGNGEWKTQASFETLEAAKTYLNKLIGITDVAA